MAPVLLMALVCGQVSPNAPDGAARPEAVLWVPQLPLGAEARWQGTVRSVEEMVRAALARLAPFRVLTSAAVEERLGRPAVSRWLACADAGCALPLVRGMDVAWWVTLRVTPLPGSLWRVELEVAPVDGPARYAELEAAQAEQLWAGAEPLVREALGGTALVLQDARLAERLGTTGRGVEALRTQVARNPDQNLTDAWTAVMLDHTAPNLRTLQGGLLAAAGLVFLAQVVAGAPAFVWATQALAFHGPPLGNGPSRATADGGYRLPWLVFPLLGLWGLAALVPAGLSVGAWALFAWERLAPRALPVDPRGCCRRETRVLAHRQRQQRAGAGPPLAALGAVGASVTPMLGVAVMLAVGAVTVWLVPALLAPSESTYRTFFGPTVVVPRAWFTGFQAAAALFGVAALFGASGLLATGAAALALLLLALDPPTPWARAG